jgi:hypothetical protein
MTWFDEDSSKLMDKRNQSKLQWLQNPNQTNEDNTNNVRRETSRTFRKMRQYVREKSTSLKQTLRTKISETYTGK